MFAVFRRIKLHI